MVIGADFPTTRPGRSYILFQLGFNRDSDRGASFRLNWKIVRLSRQIKKMREIRTLAVNCQLLLLLGILSNSFAATVVSANNVQHASLQLRSPMEKSNAGFSSHEMRSYGNMISEISDEECDAPKNVLASTQVKPLNKISTSEADMNTFTGPRVNFYWKPEKEGAKKVTMCGSWTGWKEHYNLSRNLQTGIYEAVVDNIPIGEHQFKVCNCLILTVPAAKDSQVLSAVHCG